MRTSASGGTTARCNGREKRDMSNPNLQKIADHAAAVPPAPPSDAQLAEAWFDAPPPSSRRASVPPPSQVGEFLGDELADSWLR